MKLLFVIPFQKVNPDQIVTYFLGRNIGPPIGVMLIASYLREQNWPGEMEICDLRLSVDVKESNGSYYRGDTPEEFEKSLAEIKPDIVAISSMFSWQIGEAYLVAEIAKRVNPNIITVLGGYHASSVPIEIIKEKSLDYVVMGEGEKRFHQLLLNIEANKENDIQGVISKEEDSKLLGKNKKVPIRFIEPLDDLPLPAYDMVDMERYFFLQSHGYSSRPREYGKRVVSVMTSRGCPHQCIFCSIHLVNGYKWRNHSPEYVKRHLEFLIDKYDVDYIHFEDDNFTHDPERYDVILDILMNLKKRLRWDTPNGVRGDVWNLDRVRRTKEAGCQYLIVAIESGVQRVLDEVVKKRLDLKKAEVLMEACDKVGLQLYAFFLTGLPGETKQDIRDSIDYALDKFKRFNVMPTLNLAIPLPGTEFYKKVIDGHLYEGKLECSTNQVITDEFDKEYITKEHNRWRSGVLKIAMLKSVTSPKMLRLFIQLSRSYRFYFLFMAKAKVQSFVFRRKPTTADSH